MNKLIPLVMVILAGYIIWYNKTDPPPIGIHVPAKVAPQVKNIPKVSINVPKIKVYLPAAKAKLKLPASFNPDSFHVIESSRVAADDHPTTVTTILNADTGETTTVVRREPLPWFTLKKSGALGLNYQLNGLKTLYVRQDIFQVKSLVVSGSASIRSDLDRGIGIQLEWRW